MNWGEFKAALEAAGVKDDTVIDWIDVAYPDAETWDLNLVRPNPDYEPDDPTEPDHLQLCK